MSRRRKPKTREDKAVAAVRAARGEDRKDHFKTGKTARMWLPYRTLTRNRRRDESRSACRGKVRDW